MKILDRIENHGDLLSLSQSELFELTNELRAFLIENIAKTGGHLASNLGAVEISLAFERVFDTNVDRLIFDVGHQCYIHKILTGRKNDFSNLRKLGGISGFPKPSESPSDAAIAGHASNSISLALGMARARTLQKEDYKVVAMIGDGALTGGLAYEGLCNVGASKEPLIIVLNDNGMSIDSNVGGMSTLLGRQRVKSSYISFKRKYRSVFKKIPAIYNFNHKIKEWLKRKVLPRNMFCDLGFEYLGPVDGHNLEQMELVMNWAKELNCPVLIHAITTKGRGYQLAEDRAENYHGVSSFDPEVGVEESDKMNFSKAFGEALEEYALLDEKIAAITAAMTSGTGLTSFANKFEKRFFDVGIAEGHGVTMACGMADRGLIPVFAVYSSFLQRAYDMLIHDASISREHIVLAVDRAGLVGSDGETHQGTFDVSFLSSVPNMAILAPSNYSELKTMLGLALYEVTGPVAIRYPRGSEGLYKKNAGKIPISILKEGKDISLVSYGILINNVIKASEMLEEQGISVEIIKINLIKPLDTKTIIKSLNKTKNLLVVEDICEFGSVGSEIAAAIGESKLEIKVIKRLNTGTGLVKHGEVSELQKIYNLDPKGIFNEAIKLLESERNNEENPS